MVNRIGPRTDPCGIPYFNSCGSDVDLLIWTVWVQPVRYYWNQSKTLPLIPNDEVGVDGQSYQMQHWDRVEWVLLPHECRLPEGGHFENVGELSQCCAVDDMLIERLHTDGELLDDLQAAHIQCVLQVWTRKKGSKQACHSRLPFTWLFVAVKRLNWLEICSISVHQNPAGAWNIVHTNQSVMCD